MWIKLTCSHQYVLYVKPLELYLAGGCLPIHTVPADCCWLCLSLYLISLNHLFHWALGLLGQEQHGNQICYLLPG